MALVHYERNFTADELRSLETGVSARGMEQKWDIVCHREDSHVSFTRAWTGQLWCVLPVDMDTGTCTELFVDSGYMDMLNRTGVPHEVIALFELVLNPWCSSGLWNALSCSESRSPWSCGIGSEAVVCLQRSARHRSDPQLFLSDLQRAP